MVSLEIATIVIGTIYGYLKPGKEDRKALFKKGLMIGVILALVFVGLGIVFAGTKLLLFSGVVGAVMFIEVIILAVLFIVGTFIGDWLEEKTKSKSA
jgi:preprotein translocase subunit SecY